MITIQITCSTGAATDAILAIERFAEMVYFNRRVDAAEQARYNELGAIVVPLRDARDAALWSRGPQPDVVIVDEPDEWSP